MPRASNNNDLFVLDGSDKQILRLIVFVLASMVTPI